ncbi:hypothetical protein QNA23_30250 [Rhodococcus erythropolis]|uniref:hypothetical protein n=1 Tax=Rhodococcus erythropolis TaxID=1833 RepID=UPI0024B907A4|nr:hypothetical protein [Rhodococcus erythropolis]MDJ0407802.1 hypothetical protein [Rhodococcus erythropolis]
MFLLTFGGKRQVIEHRIDQRWQFAQPLERFDGLERSSLTVSKIPEGRYYEDLSDIEKISMSENYIQAAGSAEAMSVEVRRRGEDGTARLYIVGHPSFRNGEPDVRIPFHNGKHTLTVYSNEVFDAAEAADLFLSWVTDGRIDETAYQLREFDLGTG